MPLELIETKTVVPYLAFDIPNVAKRETRARNTSPQYPL